MVANFTFTYIESKGNEKRKGEVSSLTQGWNYGVPVRIDFLLMVTFLTKKHGVLQLGKYEKEKRERERERERKK